MIPKNEKELKIMGHGGRILANILNSLKKYTKPGLTTNDIETKAIVLLTKYKVKSPFKNYNGYPANTCISINEEIVHGIPGNRKINEGDIVSIDCGVRYKGYCTDSAITFPVGHISNEKKRLIKITRKSLNEAIKIIKPGTHLGTIQSKIQEIILDNNMGLVKDLTGHGIGRNLQEEPQIPNYGQKNSGIILKEGMTFCLEPMVTLGSGNIILKNDGWTIVSKDNTSAAHFEHTIAVTKHGYKILTKID